MCWNKHRQSTFAGEMWDTNLFSSAYGMIIRVIYRNEDKIQV